MRNRNLIAMSLISLALVACSSDEDLKQTTGQDQAGEALVSLKLDVARAQTKGSPDATNKQEGTTEESEINNLTVVVVYEDETKVVVPWSNMTWKEEDKTITFKAPEGLANFYVYANVHDGDIPDVLDDLWEQLLSSTEGVSGYYDADNGFFMSNQNGDPISYTINASTENKLTVPIERAAAKVTVDYSDVSTSEYGGDLSNVKFALGNIANRFYLLEQSNNTYIMPTGDDIGYDQTTVLGEESEAWLEALGTKVEESNRTTLRGAYCAENFPSDAKQNNTTYVKFQTTFKPSNALKLESLIDDPDDYNFKVSSVSNVETENAETFYVVLEGDQDWKSHYVMKSDLFENSTDTNPKNGITFKVSNSGDYIEVEGIKGITRLSLPYTNGTCYFGPIWFNLAKDGQSSPVYRNDWYHLTIKSIKLPGSPKEPTAETDGPLVPDVNVNLTVSVLGWEWEERVIDLQ
ncbi:Mfa1 family fimbria major subunit [Parabacteroides sp.]